MREEREPTPVGPADEVVFAARGREGRRELGVAQRPDNGKYAARDPHRDQQRRAFHGTRHDRGRTKYSGADDKTDDDRGRVAEREDLRRAGA